MRPPLRLGRYSLASGARTSDPSLLERRIASFGRHWDSRPQEFQALAEALRPATLAKLSRGQLLLAFEVGAAGIEPATSRV